LCEPEFGGLMEMMRLIVGLGNIGKKYEQTRHNFGFVVLEDFREQFGFSDWN
jgi:PTH1 family peptidyl-tRNA hydrolase